MKKFLSFLIVFLMIASVSSAELLDLSAYTDDELLSIRSSIDIELSKRQQEKDAKSALLEFDMSDCHIILEEVELTTDYDGKDTIVLHYQFTNLGTEEKSFYGIFKTQIYQNGKKLETTFLSDGTNASTTMEKIKNGAKIEVKQVYQLYDVSSPIEIKLGDSFMSNFVECVYYVNSGN